MSKLVVAGFVLGAMGIAANAAADLQWPALCQWIWADRDRYDGYNDTIEARKIFEWPEVSKATLRIAADSLYRLYINGEWVNDGPARSWPSHYQYDVIDVAKYLTPGKNEIRILVKFFGVGTFHQAPKEAGLLAELDAVAKDGKSLAVGTDATWEVRDATEYLKGSPKQSVQMGIFENCDMRLKTDVWRPAVARYGYADDNAPWKNLEPRDCPLLTHVPFAFKAVNQTNVIAKSPWRTFIFPTMEWTRKGVPHANNHVVVTGLFATVVKNDAALELTVDADGNTVYVDGKRAKDDVFSLAPGAHFVLVSLTEYTGHWRLDTELHLKATGAYTLENALNGSQEDVWTFAPLPGTDFQASDFAWSLMPAHEQSDVTNKIDVILKENVEAGKTLEGFKKAQSGTARILSAKNDTTEAVHFLFKDRRPTGSADAFVTHADAVVTGAGGPVEIAPSPDGDIELVYDLGEQNVGHWQFDIEGNDGLIVDLAAVEYIAKDGRVQHTDRYRNAMRYVCHEGRNAYTAWMRRSGRYVFMTLRNQTVPVKLYGFQLIESTYPVQPIGKFACSDERLNKIWEISARTLKLCMEDSFTDCPLYEQTLWVGDARNEGQFAYTTFDAVDLAKRCAKLTAYSLDEYPMALCQVPTTWEIVLPAWSFLWGRMLWDYYYYTGDTAFPREMYPYMIKNLKGAASYSDERGLFSAPFWNMFDWSGIDDGHNSVTHCSMFAVGAVDAALGVADALGIADDKAWLEDYRAKLVKGINGLWNDEKNSYVDSVHNGGKLSEKTSVHTNFLSLLYDIVPEEHKQAALDNVIAPPAGMTLLGSPFAAMYLFEALEKMGRQDVVMKDIYAFYQPMLDENATTVWESFSTGTTGGNGFPTRSHTHAWSSAPVQFLNSIVLGIVQTEAGGKAYTISPWVTGLTHAEGASASVNGPVTVAWKIADGTLAVEAKAPDGVTLKFARNATMDGLKALFNGGVVK